MLSSQIIRESISSKLFDTESNEWMNAQSSTYNVDKNSVLLETQMFNEASLNPLKCYDTLTKVLYLLLTKGVSLTPLEESNLFFSVTKLFQSNNDRLRRMFYLAIKTLKMGEGEAFIVISSLIKDMNSGTDGRRANAIRVLSKIVDSPMAIQIDRFLKTAIVDKSPFVASASLVCALRLLKICPDLIRRWVSEVTEAIRAKNRTVQYHALSLLYEMKKSDRLALRKTLGNLLANPVQGPLAECCLIRYVTQLLLSEFHEHFERSVLDYLNSRLRNSTEMSILEAAQSLCLLVVKIPSLDLSNALTALQLLLGSRRPVIRFSAIRVLNQFSQSNPQLVQSCNTDIEVLLSDSNKHIAIMALTTLLKTSNECTIDRLVKQVSTLMSDVSDHSRLSIIKALRQLALSYPSKHSVLLSFLADEIREEASLDVKQELVDTIALLMHDTPQALEMRLLYLCEYIEDCEYPLLCIKVLTLLGDFVPQTSSPSKYIRYIYNRLILESPAVRASAIHALTSIAYSCPNLTSDISTLLESCLLDEDDEIRERMYLYFKALHNPLDNDSNSTVDSLSLDELMQPSVSVSLNALLSFTHKFLSDQNTTPGDYGTPLDFTHLPCIDEIRTEDTHSVERSTSQKINLDHDTSLKDNGEYLLDIISSIDSTIQPGLFDHSTLGIYLTEEEAEYSVQCIKHIFQSRYLLVQFYISNTMRDQTLSDLDITLSSFETSVWRVVGKKKIDSLPGNTEGSIYVLLHLESFLKVDEIFIPVQQEIFSTVLFFHLNEPDTQQSYSDNYVLEHFVINVGDYFVPKSLKKEQFKDHWATLKGINEFSANFMLNYNDLETATTSLVELLHLAPVKEPPSTIEGKTSHTLLCSGVFSGGSLLLARCYLVCTEEHGCVLKITCRTKLKDISTPFLSIF